MVEEEHGLEEEHGTSEIAQGSPRPFFTLLSGSNDRDPELQSSVFDHILNNVVSWFSNDFEARGLPGPGPGKWSEVSDRHRQIMHSAMAELHSQLEGRPVDFRKLPLDAESWQRLQKNQMLNDLCVEFMTRALVQAVGGTMPGAPTADQAVSPLVKTSAPTADQAVSPLVKTSALHAAKFVVLAILQTERLRAIGAGTGANGDVTPILRMLVGKANVAAALEGRLDPLDKKDLLFLGTRRLHSTMGELARLEGKRWKCCIHDTLQANAKMDPALQRGMTLLLEETGLKDGKFKYVSPKPFIKQKGKTECGVMVFINLAQKLTGELLDPAYWDLCDDLARLFFDLWIFRIAESKGAIPPGYLR